MIITRAKVTNAATDNLYNWLVSTIAATGGGVPDSYVVPDKCCSLVYWPDAGNDDGILIVDNFDGNQAQELTSTVAAPNVLGPFDSDLINLRDIKLIASGNGSDYLWVQIVVA